MAKKQYMGVWGDRRLIHELIALRAVKGISQTDIAVKLNWSSWRISKLENGRDDDAKLGDLRAYAKVVGHDFRVEVMPKEAYEFQALLCKEEEGGYSAHALCLPGVVSQGETEEEAKQNIAEAVAAALSTYLDDGGAVPWAPVEIERAEGDIEHRIFCWLL